MPKTRHVIVLREQEALSGSHSVWNCCALTPTRQRSPCLKPGRGHQGFKALPWSKQDRRDRPPSSVSTILAIGRDRTGLQAMGRPQDEAVSSWRLLAAPPPSEPPHAPRETASLPGLRSLCSGQANSRFRNASWLLLRHWFLSSGVNSGLSGIS